MIRRPPRSTLSSSSAASDVYKRQGKGGFRTPPMHGVVYNLASTLQKNDKGSWYGWSVTQDRIMEDGKDTALYGEATNLQVTTSKGNVQTKDVEEKAKDNTPY